MGIFENRKRQYERLKGAIHKQLSTGFRQKSSDDIVIIFSPSSKLALFKYEFKADSLHISDSMIQYYLRGAGNQSKVIGSFIAGCGYKRAAFLGSSKGAFASLLWSSLINSRQPPFDVRGLAFSPQTKIYPHNAVLDVIPSYGAVLRRANSDQMLNSAMEKYGNLTPAIMDSHPLTHIYYSAKNKMDSHEVRGVEWMPRIKCFPVNISFHGAISTFITDTSDAEKLRKLADKIYRDAETDPDLRAQLPADRGEFIADFVDCAGGDLNAALDALFADIPPPK
jgi:hypothetical protein